MFVVALISAFTVFSFAEENADESESKNKLVIQNVYITSDSEKWSIDIDEFYIGDSPLFGFRVKETKLKYVGYEISIDSGWAELSPSAKWYFNGKEIPDFMTTMVVASQLDPDYGETVLIYDYSSFGSAVLWHILHLFSFGIWF